MYYTMRSHIIYIKEIKCQHVLQSRLLLRSLARLNLVNGGVCMASIYFCLDCFLFESFLENAKILHLFNKYLGYEV